jgi:hypothetical protein
MRARSLVSLCVVLALGTSVSGACSGGEEELETFTEDGISFRYPEGWHVVGFSRLTSPRRLALSSYPLPADAVEGDCGGREAVELLPPEGVLVLLIDYGERASFPARPGRLTMQAGEFSHYECFGPSTMFRFGVGRRDLQAHVALGPRTTDEARDRALVALASLSVAGS